MAALSKPIDIEEIDQGMKRSMAAVNVGTSVCLYIRTYVYLWFMPQCVPLVGSSSLCRTFCTYTYVHTYCVVHICVCNA